MAEFDDDFLFVLGLTSESVVSVGMIEADVAMSSRGVGVFESLLLLLSFKLRRRTGFLRIRLNEKSMIVINGLMGREEKLPETSFSFTKISHG